MHGEPKCPQADDQGPGAWTPGIHKGMDRGGGFNCDGVARDLGPTPEEGVEKRRE